MADITYLPTWSGFLDLAIIVDTWSRLVVGWLMASHLRTELLTGALEMALARRRPTAGLIHHSDRGFQYTSLALGRRLADAGIAASMGSVGDAYDNARAESFFASLASELIDRGGGPIRRVRLHRGVLQPQPLDDRPAEVAPAVHLLPPQRRIGGDGHHVEVLNRCRRSGRG